MKFPWNNNQYIYILKIEYCNSYTAVRTLQSSPVTSAKQCHCLVHRSSSVVMDGRCEIRSMSKLSFGTVIPQAYRRLYFPALSFEIYSFVYDGHPPQKEFGCHKNKPQRKRKKQVSFSDHFLSTFDLLALFYPSVSSYLSIRTVIHTTSAVATQLNTFAGTVNVYHCLSPQVQACHGAPIACSRQSHGRCPQ